MGTQDNYRLIPLTNNMSAIVDLIDYEELSKFKWHARKCDSLWYACGMHKNKDNSTVYMHRYINKTPKGFVTDHINGNTLDNRRSNLRSVNRQQNSINRGKASNNTSGYVGVTWDKYTRKWIAQIMFGQKHIYLGRYFDINDAIMARQSAERKYFGEYLRGDAVKVTKKEAV